MTPLTQIRKEYGHVIVRGRQQERHVCSHVPPSILQVQQPPRGVQSLTYI